MAYAKRVKNLCSYGTLYDRDGYMLFKDNLIDLFSHLLKHNKKIDFSQKYKIIISVIIPNNDYPYRVQKEKTVTFRSFLNYWKNTFQESFSLESYEKNSKKEMNVEMVEIGNAWGLYGVFLQYQKQESLK